MAKSLVPVVAAEFEMSMFPDPFGGAGVINHFDAVVSPSRMRRRSGNGGAWGRWNVGSPPAPLHNRQDGHGAGVFQK